MAADSTTDTPPAEETEEVVIVSGTQSAQEVARRIQLSLQGLQYDLNHWSQLPPVRQGQPTLRCVQYVVSRNQRGPYITIVVVCFLLLLCVSVAVRSGRRRYP